MTVDAFRKIALGLPEAIESAHMGHPDFRVRGRIFATLSADGVWGVVMLNPEEQEVLVSAEPTIFEPAAGAWGRAGSTKVRLAEADRTTLKSALTAAHRSVLAKLSAKKARPKKTISKKG
jgi:hypothetical protein